MARNMKVRHRSRPVTPSPIDDNPVPVDEGSSTPESEGTYDVGYGRPPKHSRFKPGQSGNPKGRPRGSKSLLVLVGKALDEKVVVREGGRQSRLLKREVVARQLANKAVSGDHRAIQTVLKLDDTLAADVREAEAQSAAAMADAPLDTDEQAILDEYATRIIEKHEQSRNRGIDRTSDDTTQNEENDQ